ncbi:MAG: hypothetical protein HDR38_06800 [Treponema sp.]|nr:hypothetical protein [Treponema sp.]
MSEEWMEEKKFALCAASAQRVLAAWFHFDLLWRFFHSLSTEKESHLTETGVLSTSGEVSPT